MHIRQWTAISLLAAMGALAACGAEEAGEPIEGAGYEDPGLEGDVGYEEEPVYEEDTDELTPAPESAVTDVGPAGGEADAGGELGEPGDMMEDTDAGTIDFAALDTDTDGMIVEDEWERDAVNGMEFSEVDEDASGDVDRQEFEQAVAGTPGGETLGTTEFAALDTDSDGTLGENEWQAGAVNGMEFSEVDGDGSGDIDREEFEQALTDAGGQMGSGTDSGMSSEETTSQ